MIRVPCGLLLAAAASAHVMSMSTGDLTIAGVRAHFELRIPLYEVEHVTRPETTLLAHVRFAGARTQAQSCRADTAAGAYVCDADYVFRSPVENLEVECTLASVTVPNHIHLLHATLGGKREEAVFDRTFTRATIRFHDPSAGEEAVTQAAAGFLRALGGPVQWLLLGALALAARSRRELGALAAAFLLAQAASVVVVPLTNWQPPPRFVEAASALTVAYLAVEMLLLPRAGARWAVAGAMGAFHGLWLDVFVVSTRYHAALVLAGAAVGQAAVVAALGWAAARIALRRAVPVLASALLVFGLVWFWLGLRG
ncbi:MAG: HupE/UreJ family protein [Acidobacteria bacterium]|nr:HupE/UreJ family protein [Acidobacteriota bacterium]